jgi:hypothetical protein
VNPVAPLIIIAMTLACSVAALIAIVDLASQPACAAAASEYRHTGGMRARNVYASRRYGMRRASHRRSTERRLSDRRGQAADRPAPAVESASGDGGRGYFEHTFAPWTLSAISLLPVRVPPVRADEAGDAASPALPASPVNLNQRTENIGCD